MAVYGIKYQTTWAALNGVSGTLYIEQLAYAGSVTSLTLQKEGADDFKIETKCAGWDTHIIGKTLEFSIRNDNTDFYELLPLLTAAEKEYRVRVVIDTPISQARTLFEGFINSDTNSQKYLHRQVISIVASSYLSKLEYGTLSSIEVRKGVIFINLIDEILRSIGATYNIRVNSSLYAKDAPLSVGQSLFNKNGVFTELFWEDNVKRKTNQEILKMLLTSFYCYLYWEDGYWYIERLNDIWDETPTYVEYTTGVVYSETDTGVIIERTRSLADLHAFTFIEQSQTIYIDPGFKIIQLNLDIEDHLLLNLTINDFSEIQDGSYDGQMPPLPDERTWLKWDYYTWDTSGPYRNITNAIRRTTPTPTYHSFIEYGLYTRFKIDVVNEDSMLEIKFKYGAIRSVINGHPFVSWEDITFEFYVGIWSPLGSYFIVQQNDGTWKLDGVYSADFRMNKITVSGTQFVNATETADIQLSVPLGKVNGLSLGPRDLVVIIGTEEVIYKDETTAEIKIEGIYGDVYITTNGTLENNEITGTANTSYLEKKEIEMSLLDVQSVNYISGILQGSTLAEKTESWADVTNPVYKPLVDHVMSDLFRIYNESRQRIKGLTFGTLSPSLFSLYTDSKQSDKKFILLNSIYHPIYNVTEVELFEFDKDTEIILNDI